MSAERPNRGLQPTSAVGRRKRLPLALAAESRYVGPTGPTIMEHFTFPVLDETGTTVVTHEVLEVERETPTTVRLLHSPALVAGVARGDRLSVDPEHLAGFRILQRGGMIAATVAFSAELDRRNAEHELRTTVESLGGVCEGGPPKTLVFSIPARSGFPQIEAWLNQACSKFGAGWFFGNVFGFDGEPLGWWAEGSR